MKLLFENWNKYMNENLEAYVLERSGVGWNEKFVVGGSPRDPTFGAIEDAQQFSSEEEASDYASKTDIHLSVANKKDYESEEKEEEYTKLPSVYGRKGEHGIPLTPGQVVQRLRLSIKPKKKP